MCVEDCRLQAVHPAMAPELADLGGFGPANPLAGIGWVCVHSQFFLSGLQVTGKNNISHLLQTNPGKWLGKAR